MKKLSLIVAGALAANIPLALSAQQPVVVRKDTVIAVRSDTTVRTHEDTAVVTTTVTTSNAPVRALNIATALATLPNYKTLTSLLNLAHLTPTLRSSAPMTLFAPTDDAFSQVAPADLETLRTDTAALRKLLLNHMVSGKIDTRELLKLRTATTMEGSRIRFDYKNGHPRVNEHVIVQPGILVSNGFIHGIDGVINK